MTISVLEEFQAKGIWRMRHGAVCPCVEDYRAAETPVRAGIWAEPLKKDWA